MKAFWCVRPNSGGDPSWPSGFEATSTITAGDLRAFGPDAAPADHKHAAMGVLAVHDDHGHWIFYKESEVLDQEFYGSGTAHNHTIPEAATHLVVWVWCTDSMYTFLIGELPNLLELGQCAVSGPVDGSYTIGAVDSTTWDGAERTSWENKFDNFGIDLPVLVDNDLRLTNFVLTGFLAPSQNVRKERNFRPGSMEA